MVVVIKKYYNSSLEVHLQKRLNNCVISTEGNTLKIHKCHIYGYSHSDNPVATNNIMTAVLGYKNLLLSCGVGIEHILHNTK